MADDVLLRQVSPAELAGLHETLELAFHAPSDPAVRARRAETLELDRTIAGFDGDQMVGTSSVLSQQLSIPGGELPCAGVSMVTVRPTHRRRGILRRMMIAQLAQARRRGEPLAALWASEGGIYGRFGFGPATWEAHVEIDRHGSPPRPGSAVGRDPSGHPGPDRVMRVELRDPVGAGELLTPLWDELRRQRAGNPRRTPTWWATRILTDLPQERDGALEKRLALARDAAGAPRGYALYHVRAGASPAVEVQELVAPDPAADAALWGYLCGIDLVDQVRAPSRPVDDPVVLRFDDVRRARLTDLREALWLRLLDVSAALAARTWATTEELTLALTDRLVPENEGTWRLETSAGGAARCTRSDRTPDLVLDVGDLSAAYLGATPSTRLADAGLVDERTPGVAARLDAALHVARAPWTPEQF